MLSSLPNLLHGAPWVALPLDNLHGSVDPTANGTLHWVPRHDDGLRRRMALIADWINAAEPDLMVVDVSVEVAMLCRLLGVPTVVVAMRGDRLDRAHRAAYDSAHALLAPWAAEVRRPRLAGSLAQQDLSRRRYFSLRRASTASGVET